MPLQGLETQPCQLSFAYERHALDPNIRGITPPHTAPDWWRNHTQAQLSESGHSSLQSPAAQTVTSLHSAEHGCKRCERRSLRLPVCLFTCAPRANAHIGVGCLRQALFIPLFVSQHSVRRRRVISRAHVTVSIAITHNCKVYSLVEIFHSWSDDSFG